MINIVFVIAIALLVALLLFLAQTLKPLPGVDQSYRPQRWRKRFRIGFILVPILVLLCGIWAFFIEPNRLIVNQQTVQIDNWPKELSGLRVALIGDVHTGSPFINDQKLQKIVELTNQQNPDLIVLLGDYMSPDSWHSHKVEPAVTASHLKNLKASLGVYAVLGNHDWWHNGEKVGQAFEDNGIRVLEDDVVEFKWRARSFWLAGLADLWTRPQHISETIAKNPSGAFCINAGESTSD